MIEQERLISIRMAALHGISRVRLPKWANPLDHLKIDILQDGQPGPWTHLFSPMNLMLNRRDPLHMLAIEMDYDAEEWLPYTGPVAGSEEYKSEQAYFAEDWKDGK